MLLQTDSHLFRQARRRLLLKTLLFLVSDFSQLLFDPSLEIKDILESLDIDRFGILPVLFIDIVIPVFLHLVETCLQFTFDCIFHGNLFLVSEVVRDLAIQQKWIVLFFLVVFEFFVFVDLVDLFQLSDQLAMLLDVLQVLDLRKVIAFLHSTPNDLSLVGPLAQIDAPSLRFQF